MTVTQYGWCPRCNDRRELVPQDAGGFNVLACHACGVLDIYESKRAYEQSREDEL